MHPQQPDLRPYATLREAPNAEEVVASGTSLRTYSESSATVAVGTDSDEREPTHCQPGKRRHPDAGAADLGQSCKRARPPSELNQDVNKCQTALCEATNSFTIINANNPEINDTIKTLGEVFMWPIQLQKISELLMIYSEIPGGERNEKRRVRKWLLGIWNSFLNKHSGVIKLYDDIIICRDNLITNEDRIEDLCKAFRKWENPPQQLVEALVRLRYYCKIGKDVEEGEGEEDLYREVIKSMWDRVLELSRDMFAVDVSAS